MLLDAVANPRPKRTPQEPGTVRTAGLLNLLDAAQALGGKYANLSKFADEEGARPGTARDLWEDYRVFKDPTGSWIMDTGPTLVDRPLMSYGDMATLRDRGVTLREFLDGTEMADTLGPQLDQYRVGHLPLHDYHAGVSPPRERLNFGRDGGIIKETEPGVLFIGSEYMKGPERAPLFEHEFQHVLQQITGAPVGTNVDNAPREVEFLRQAGRAPLDAEKRFVEAAKFNQQPKYYQPYHHSFGEVEARLAADRLDPRRSARAPDTLDYSMAGGLFSDPSAYFKFRNADQTAMDAWWANRWKKK